MFPNTGEKQCNIFWICFLYLLAAAGIADREIAAGYAVDTRQSTATIQPPVSPRKRAGAAHTAAPLPKIVHPKQLLFVDVANVNLPKCNGKPQLGRSSFVIKDNSSARHLLAAAGIAVREIAAGYAVDTLQSTATVQPPIRPR
ncbi:hypothetical protein NPIL_174181, partial [Nephila pilipes]